MRKIANLTIVGCLAALLILQGALMERCNRNPLGTIGTKDITVRNYHLLMYANPAMWQLKWFGIPTQQNPNDVWIIQEIISEIKPDVIIETGTFHGGSSAIWAMIQREVNPQGKVITIDIEDHASREPIPSGLRDRIQFIIGGAVDPDVLNRVKKSAQGKSVLVLLDSDHHKAHVMQELKCYSSFVSVGSYIIVQDTNINGHPVLTADFASGGPMEAVEEFLAANLQFKSDKTREKLLFTQHPNGYLKRIK